MNKKNIKPLNMTIEAKSAVPVYEQVKQGIKLAIISGYLEEGDQLMSIRELAAKLKIHPNTIAKVYFQLETEGFMYSRQGKGYFVQVDRANLEKEKDELFQKVINDTISRVLKLGYTLEDIVVELQKRMAETVASAPAINVNKVEETTHGDN